MTSTAKVTIDNELIYTGFWPRVGATLIDTLIFAVITIPTLILIYGSAYLESTEIFLGTADVLINWVLPLYVVMAFWAYKQATPGKMAVSAKIVDAKTGGKPTFQQYVVRYIGYFISTIPLGLGLLWVAWDDKKQGWHDKLASTVVVNPKKSVTATAQFDAS